MGIFARIMSSLGLRKDDSDSDAAESSDAAASDDASAAGEGEASSEAQPKTAMRPEDDPERDLELEAQDDAADFDFGHDIARYFTAEFRVEQAWNNRERRDQLLEEYGLRDGAHWLQVKATFKRWLESPEGKAKYPSEEALLQARMTTTQTVTVDELEQMIEDARRAREGG